MRLKTFTGPTYTAQARNAALKYIEKNEYRKNDISIPLVLVPFILLVVLIILLFA